MENVCLYIFNRGKNRIQRWVSLLFLWLPGHYWGMYTESLQFLPNYNLVRSPLSTCYFFFHLLLTSNIPSVCTKCCEDYSQWHRKSEGNLPRGQNPDPLVSSSLFTLCFFVWRKFNSAYFYLYFLYFVINRHLNFEMCISYVWFLDHVLCILISTNLLLYEDTNVSNT